MSSNELSCYVRADSWFVSSQWWETALLYHDVSHWLGTSLESAMYVILNITKRLDANIYMWFSIVVFDVVYKFIDTLSIGTFL